MKFHVLDNEPDHFRPSKHQIVEEPNNRQVSGVSPTGIAEPGHHRAPASTPRAPNVAVGNDPRRPDRQSPGDASDCSGQGDHGAEGRRTPGDSGG